MPRADRSRAALTVIGSFKLVKAAGLVLLALAAHSLLHRDVAVAVAHWVSAIRIDPDSPHVHAVLSRLTRLNERQLRAFSAATLLFAGLYSVEGIGLMLRRRWAEYLTV